MKWQLRIMKTKSVCIVQVKDISNYYWEVQKPVHAAAVQARKKIKMKLRGKRSFFFWKGSVKLIVDMGTPYWPVDFPLKKLSEPRAVRRSSSI
ncbi:hypothetical protein CYOC110262_05065 [Cytobacillus oceanisediminis]|uniref:Uncharacterized protein n=1 Tax=Cytobacillus oceanisediminis TaxID=665099 RepID=A0A562K3K5_9BACI|nr:hypothetical protein IQ19_01266 [Cytobacillus oceanisediminis]